MIYMSYMCPEMIFQFKPSTTNNILIRSLSSMYSLMVVTENVSLQYVLSRGC